MTEMLYHSDSYLKEFSAVVTDIDEEAGAVALNRTTFFPGGGGQPCDTGRLSYAGNTVPVLSVSRKAEKILHKIDGKLPEVGSEVHGEIDWERRYQLMRTHSAMHVLCGVVWRDYGAQVTGGNMDPLKGRMDFEFENFSADLVHEIEGKVNVEIQNGRNIQARILPRAEAEQIPDLIRTKINLLPDTLQEIRIVEIEGLDLQADGGTHVANTKEIGTFKIVGHKSKGKINKRLKIELV
ncbi:MAG: alanyl-tRNA editing protein [Spirochaetaceae bacterium]|nr:alanyl-tRNA editing protein [Spirochaetaceae bacterium]MCF7952102.1 alanyl-tRNA editing protein [Spirochaetaceae bacterium]